MTRASGFSKLGTSKRRSSKAKVDRWMEGRRVGLPRSFASRLAAGRPWTCPSPPPPPSSPVWLGLVLVLDMGFSFCLSNRHEEMDLHVYSYIHTC